MASAAASLTESTIRAYAKIIDKKKEAAVDRIDEIFG